MVAIQTRNSVLAITVESTEGTPVEPSASGEFIPLQDDAAMTAEFESLENAEIKQSIGSSKPIQGLENPSFSFSAYMKHSGVEGQAPQFNELMKAAFGSEEVNATEYDTIAASTTSVIKVDVGEGATFSKGEALLIKDATNGYSVRNVESISTDDLTLGFEIDNAPASGVNLGKSVFYSPANSGHQSLSLWHYLGNGGVTQMMAGARVVDMSISAEAGQLINCSYTIEGLEYFYNPVVIGSADSYIDWTDDGGTFAAQISLQTYKDPHALAAEIASKMNAQTGETITVSYQDADGKFSIAATGAVFSLLWNSGANTANTLGDKIGFSVAADDTGSLSYISDSALDLSAPVSASYDSSNPVVAKNASVRLGDSDDNVCFEASSIAVTMSTPKANINSICASSGRSGSIINSREVTLSVSALLDQYESDKFRKFRENEDTRFMFNAGEKDSSGNWIAGKVVNMYMPSAVISSFNLADADGLVSLELELTAFVNSTGDGEFFMNFL